ncbi:hypothetical protein KC614_00470 [candidate division WWE3 bacterium]|uniref:Uncharacterized protein n=1 Tax=candidate division WWE3 bacterium TaxID=2053526 RepID=A0A955RRL4_UNCKA|nr:hypothetical protein [candidate division WWE3 bacterium]
MLSERYSKPEVSKFTPYQSIRRVDDVLRVLKDVHGRDEERAAVTSYLHESQRTLAVLEMEASESPLSMAEIHNRLSKMSKEDASRLWNQTAHIISKTTDAFDELSSLGMLSFVQEKGYMDNGNGDKSEVRVLWGSDGEAWYDEEENAIHMPGSPPTEVNMLMSLCENGTLPDDIEELRRQMFAKEQDVNLDSVADRLRQALNIGASLATARGSLPVAMFLHDLSSMTEILPGKVEGVLFNGGEHRLDAADAHYAAATEDDTDLQDLVGNSNDPFERAIEVFSTLRALGVSDQDLLGEYDLESIFRFDEGTQSFPDLEKALQERMRELEMEWTGDDAVLALMQSRQAEKALQRILARELALQSVLSEIAPETGFRSEIVSKIISQD